MSSVGRRRRSLIAGIAALASLAAPVAADAASYTVKGGDGPCGGGDLACGGLVEAAAAAAAGDVFTVAQGAYPAANFTVGNVTINGQPGVFVSGTMQFTGAGAVPSKLAKVAMVSTTADPALVISGTAGLVLSDAVVFGQYGHGVLISNSTANTIARTLVATGGAQTSAVRLDSTTGTPAKALLIESSILFGGGSGIGAFTHNNELQAPAGDIAITARHITAAGSTHGILLDSSAAAHGILGQPPAGNIAMTLTDSITFGNLTRVFTNVLGGTNSATITVPGGDNTILDGDKNAIFANAAGNNFRLRPGSIAIGRGGFTAGESTTDLDGEDRSAAPTDLGGDEYNNAPPVAKLAVSTKTPRAGRPVTFDAGGSTDREATYGGGIVQYRWLFSDGATATTTGPTTTHTFSSTGGAAASVVVVDRQGAVSDRATVGLTLVDGTPPLVVILSPNNTAKFSRFVTKTVTKTVKGKKRKVKRRTRRKIVLRGVSSDPSGVAQIAMTLEKLIPGKTTKTKCYWFNPKKGVTRRSCNRPAVIVVGLKKGGKLGDWSYTVRRNLAKGTYRLTAVGSDKTGAVGNAGGRKAGVVKFTLT